MYAELRKIFPVVEKAEDLKAALHEVLGTDRYEKEILQVSGSVICFERRL